MIKSRQIASLSDPKQAFNWTLQHVSVLQSVTHPSIRQPAVHRSLNNNADFDISTQHFCCGCFLMGTLCHNFWLPCFVLFGKSHSGGRRGEKESRVKPTHENTIIPLWGKLRERPRWGVLWNRASQSHSAYIHMYGFYVTHTGSFSNAFTGGFWGVNCVCHLEGHGDLLFFSVTFPSANFRRQNQSCDPIWCAGYCGTNELISLPRVTHDGESW